MNVKDWFLQLAPRERLLIAVAAGLVVITLVIVYGIRPLFDGANRAGQRVADKQEVLAQLDTLAARLGPGGGSNGAPATASGQSLVVLVDQTTRAAGLGAFVKRNQPDGTTNIRLRFENAPFDALIPWLGEMQNRHGLRAVSANIDTSDQPGRVNCNLVLSRGG